MSKSSFSLLQQSHQQFTYVLPAVHSVIFSCFVYGAIYPIDGVVAAFLVWVCQLLDFTLICHKCVCHHAVHEKHERWSCTVYKGTQPPHDHHRGVFPGGKSKLQKKDFSMDFENSFNTVVHIHNVKYTFTSKKIL